MLSSDSNSDSPFEIKRYQLGKNICMTDWLRSFMEETDEQKEFAICATASYDATENPSIIFIVYNNNECSS